MEGLKNAFLKSFFFLGERAGLILIVIAFFAFFWVQTTNKAFSEASAPQEVQQNPEWYKHDIVLLHPTKLLSNSYSIEAAVVTPTPTPVFDSNPAGIDAWIKLAECESHQNWSENTGNGYYGGLQFSTGAWQSVGGSGLPSDASRDEQINRGKMLQAARGWGPWRNCAAKIGVL